MGVAVKLFSNDLEKDSCPWGCGSELWVGRTQRAHDGEREALRETVSVGLPTVWPHGVVRRHSRWYPAPCKRGLPGPIGSSGV